MDFREVDHLLKQELWQEVVQILEQGLQCCDDAEAFKIHDQLVSTYFRLGEFKKAKEHAYVLDVLSQKMRTPESNINALYKLSATLRGMGCFDEAKTLIQRAVSLVEELCASDHSLVAKVYFNAGALEADSLNGDLSLAISYYEQAISYFEETKERDYWLRTQIRLGKASLLQGNLCRARTIVDSLKGVDMDKRTEMFFQYLEGGLLLKEGRREEAREVAEKALEVALSLHAKADIARLKKQIEETEGTPL